MADQGKAPGLSARQLQTLLLTGQAISQEQEPERICQWVCDAATSLVGASLAAVALAPTKQNGPRAVYGKLGDSPLPQTLATDLAELAEIEWSAPRKTGMVAMLPEANLPSGPNHPAISHLVRAHVRTLDQELGVLMAGWEEPWELGPGDQFVLSTLANEAAVALENTRLRREADQRAERLAGFNRIIRAITSSLDLPGVFTLLSSEVQHLIPHDRASVALVDPGGQTATVYGTTGQDDVLGAGSVVPIAGSMVGRVITTGQGYFRTDLEEGDFVETPGLLALGIRSNVMVPLWDGDVCFGSLNMGSRQVGKYGLDEMLLAGEIARQIAVAIMNARHCEDAPRLAMLEERNRLAREIHDSLAQGLTAIIWQINATERLVERGGEQALQYLDRIRNLVRESLQEARRSVWDLRAGPLERLSLVEALREETDKVAGDGDIQTSFTVSGEERVLPPGVEGSILRICQEALGNILKHAGATQVDVSITFDDSRVRLAVRDNGVGFDPDIPTRRDKDGGGFGLITMKERARLLGGDVSVQSGPGLGTLVEATLSLK